MQELEPLAGSLSASFFVCAASPPPSFFFFVDASSHCSFVIAALCHDGRDLCARESCELSSESRREHEAALSRICSGGF